MLKSICILFSFCLISPVFGQKTSERVREKDEKTGFYGRRFTIQLGAGIHHNSLLKLAGGYERAFRKNDYYDNYRSQTVSDQFNYSLYGNLGVVLKEHLSLSVDFQYYYGNMFLMDLGTLYHDYEFGGYYFTSEFDCRVKYNTMRFMPRIEIASKGSNAPAGLVHILGIGFELSRLKSGNYKCITAYSYGRYLPQESVQITTDHINLATQLAVNITLMYGLEYRLPISKNLAWNFGAYAHANLPALFPTFIDESEYNTDQTEQMRQLAKYRFQNLFSVRTGLVIML